MELLGSGVLRKIVFFRCFFKGRSVFFVRERVSAETERRPMTESFARRVANA